MKHLVSPLPLIALTLICPAVALGEEEELPVVEEATLESSSEAPIRLDAAMLMQARAHITQSISNIAAPANYRFDGVALGVNIDAEYTVNDLWSVEAKGRLTHFPLGSDSSLKSLAVGGISVGAIRNQELAGYTTWGLAGITKLDTLVSLYADSAHANIATVVKGVYGMYLGIGLEIPTSTGEISLEAGEVISVAGFLPAPIESWVILEAHITDPTGKLPEGWDALLAYDYTYRSIAYTINGINSRVFEGLHGLRLGMTRDF